ncbi:hypothetical protein MG293_012032 [Ovis ammon polii]|uniref:Uncharacterized protein n=1 Tax=Ovis ammon polii TaxID=230172 RepID=A0AAD4Y8F6_OVIAM|nr:hypothetical protein MG293_012032 [Ovis ammon polii]
MQETGGTPPGQRSLNQEQGSTNCTSGELCSWTNNQTGPLPAGVPFGVFTLSENRLTSRPSASQEEPANPQVPGRPHVLAKAVSPCSCRNCYPRRPSRPEGACSDNGSAMKFCERQVSQNQLLPDVIKHGSKQQEGRPGYPNDRFCFLRPQMNQKMIFPQIPISKPGSGEPDLRERHAAVPGKFSSFRKPVSPRCVSPRCANPFSWDVRP